MKRVNKVEYINLDRQYLIYQGNKPMFLRLLSSRDEHEKTIEYLKELGYKNLSVRFCNG